MRIGDGRSTSIWGDNWLVDDDHPRIITRRPLHTSFLDRVADLINPNTHSWDLDVVDSHFWPIDRDRISAVPIGSIEAPDKQVWRFSSHGRFTVKSCYRNIFQTTQGNGGMASGSSNFDWKKIWNLPIPPKVRLFLWRACANILPTKAELYRRKVVSDPWCDRCGKIETIMHVVAECRDMELIWKKPPFVQCDIGRANNVEAWLGYLMNMTSQDNVCLASILMWRSWDNRNSETHGNEHIATVDMVVWEHRYLELFNQAAHFDRTSKSNDHPAKWKPPAQGIIKLNVDAVFPTKQQYFTTSMVARYWRGNCVYWCVDKCEGRPKPVDGEARAVLMAIRKAILTGWRAIEIEGDCLQVIQTLKEATSTDASYGAFTDECLSLVSSLIIISFAFVKRSCNEMANAIARIETDVRLEGFNLPPHLTMIA